MKSRTAQETLSVTTKLVLQNDTNTLGNLFGGQLLAWMDVIASVSAHRHCRRVVVTASVNNVSFTQPIKQSSIVTLEAKVSRAFKSSMETYVDVWVEDRQSRTRTKVNEGIYTFVAVDETGKPVQIPQIIPETELERERFDDEINKNYEKTYSNSIIPDGTIKRGYDVFSGATATSKHFK